MSHYQAARPRNHPPAWTPVLSGELRNQAERTLVDIAEAIPEPGMTNATLADGDAGFALCHGYLAHSGLLAAQTRKLHERAALAHLQAAVDALPTLAGLPNLIAGFTGVAWTVNHLQSIGALDDADELCDAVDGALIEWVRDRSQMMPCELLMGLSGIGLYGLARQHRTAGRELVELTVDALERSATEHQGLRTWFNNPHQLSPYALRVTPQGCFNLGLSHGVPGAIAFLSQAAASGAPLARELAADAAEWLLLQGRRYGNGSRFTYSFLSDPMEDDRGSRVAWCYGDLGIAVTLLRSARWQSNPEWESAAHEIACAAAQRSTESSQVKDAALCHGAFGNAHIFRRLYAATHDDVFLRATLRWVRTGLAMRQAGDGLAGYKTWRPARLDEGERDSWHPAAGILEGICGIGLTLLSLLSPVEPAWDQCLLLDIPDPLTRITPP